MMQTLRSIESLQAADLQVHPVWEFANDQETSDEKSVRPVERLPVQSLSGRLAATRVCFANGSTAWALIGNIDTTDPRSTEHFLTLAIEHHGSWFNLARYFDPDYMERGPEALAILLGVQVDDVFPIHYDVRHCATGNPTALSGSIWKEPRERLSRAELLKMAVP